MITAFLSATSEGIWRAFSSNGVWKVEDHTPGRDVRCLAVDPKDHRNIFTGTQGDGIFRSGDGGKTWQSSGLEGAVVKSIAVSPIENGVLYAGTKPALVFVSRDNGSTWRELESFRKIFSRHFWFSPAEAPGTAYVQAIGLSPVDPRVLIAGIEFGAVVRTDDGGMTWSDHRKGALRDCHSLRFHHSDGNWAYEGGGTGAGAAWSEDGGKTWKQSKSGLDRHYGWACAADPVRPDIWYISISPSPFKAHGMNNAEACIFRSTGGKPWEKLSGGLPQPLTSMPYALLTDPTSPGHLYAGMSNGEIWHSENYGDTWSKLPIEFPRIHYSLVMI